MLTKDKLTKLNGEERLGTHRDSEYLGAEDIDDGAEPIVTIDAAWNGQVTLQRGKENHDVISFAEENVDGLSQVRPLIINATNRKTLRKLFGDTKASTLEGKRIQLYVDHKVRDPETGGIRDGIRIRDKIPAEAKKILCESCGKPLTPAWSMDVTTLAEYTKANAGSVLCAACAKAAAEKQKETDNA